jgi:hypothetical protein
MKKKISSYIWVYTVFHNVCHIWVLPKLHTGYFLNWLATGWTVQGSNPGGDEIFCTCPDQPCGPPSLLYIGYQISFPGLKQPGHGVDHPPWSSAEVKKKSSAIPLLPLWAFVACYRVNFTYTFWTPGRNPNLSLCWKYEMKWNTYHPAGQGGFKRVVRLLQNNNICLNNRHCDNQHFVHTI